MKNFAMIGVGGFVAPRHLRAIKDNGHQLVAAVDPKDSVGILDSYFPEAHFFVEYERFDRHIDKLRRRGQGVEYVSICSPNYLHDAHIRFALRNGAHAICEKPLVLNPWNLNAIGEIEREADRRIHTILQLRLHPVIRDLRARIAAAPADTVFDVDLDYITSRGRWYHTSWKGDEEKSGGVATNIGIHFFDMLEWVFGPRRASTVHLHTPATAAGYLELARARVRWFLSIDADHLPDTAKAAGKRTHRSIRIDGTELEFSEGFNDLHSLSYAAILAGDGFGLADARPSIETAYEIRRAAPVGPTDTAHPFCAAVVRS